MVRLNFLLIIFKIDRNSCLYLSIIINITNKNKIAEVNFAANDKPKNSEDTTKSLYSSLSEL